MESIIPQEQLLNEILGDLDKSIPGLEPQNVLTSLAIVAFANRCLASYEAHFARYGLSQGRFAILMFLYHLPERTWTPAMLAKTTGVRRATMTGLLDVLERGGWISRRRNPNDGRSTEVHLSGDGRGRLKNLLPDHFSRVAAAMGGLSVKEHRTLIRLMRKFGARVASLTTLDIHRSDLARDRNSSNERHRDGS